MIETRTGQPVLVERLAESDPELDARLAGLLAETLVEAMPADSESMPGILSHLALYRDSLHGASALSVRIAGFTSTIGWDGSELLAEEIIGSAAWSYAQNERDERRVRGAEVAE